jgi:predicted amino acid-binding ACT domain protein
VDARPPGLVQRALEDLDIEQASLQDFLGLSFLLDMSGAKQSKDGVLKDLSLRPADFT